MEPCNMSHKKRLHIYGTMEIFSCLSFNTTCEPGIQEIPSSLCHSMLFEHDNGVHMIWR